eukprot:superscaffoldBa00004334_g18697
MSQRQVKERDKEREKEAGLLTPNREHVATPSTLSPGVSYTHVSLPPPDPSFQTTGPMMKEEGLLSRRRFSTCGGTASLRPPHPDGRKLIRNASFGGYNELSPISLP